MAAAGEYQGHSLEEIHGTVAVPMDGFEGRQVSRWRRFVAFAGPAFLISVGYMDPGNWATDLEAGSKYEHRLLWILLASNLMALLLQALATRLGVVTGRDLAQACRETYPRSTVVALWLLCEVAIAATDLAEVIGTIIALKLLFGLSYFIGLAVAAGDTFVLLALQRRGVRILEVVTLALVAVIGISFVVEISLARPHWMKVLGGFVPGLEPRDIAGSLYVAIAMLGATVMPHNLYLHSALVQTRAFPRTDDGKRLACRYNLYDSTLALNGAFFINAAILILAAATFFHPEAHTLAEPPTLTEAPALLHKALGSGLASVLFAIALLASGQSSTLTGTLAGQVVMEGFVRLRIRPWARRLVTRVVAIAPALVIIVLASSPSIADTRIDQRLLQLLVLSQAILSFQLPFAILPLVQFTSDRRRMGAFANGLILRGSAWLCAAFVIGLNAVLIVLMMGEWAQGAEEAGWNAWWIYAPVGSVTAALGAFLVWVGAYPHRTSPAPVAVRPSAPALPSVRYRKIGVAVEFTGGDDAVLAQAAALARTQQAPLKLIHVVEGPAANIHGAAADDHESRSDREAMAALVHHLRASSLAADGILGYGDPPAELVRIAREQDLDLLVLGTHGHRFFADLALGQTVAPVLHRLAIPILVVPTARSADSTLGRGTQASGPGPLRS